MALPPLAVWVNLLTPHSHARHYAHTFPQSPTEVASHDCLYKLSKLAANQCYHYNQVVQTGPTRNPPRSHLFYWL
jgi:hypothetical protein